jgi:hypothetical protein
MPTDIVCGVWQVGGFAYKVGGLNWCLYIPVDSQLLNAELPTTRNRDMNELLYITSYYIMSYHVNNLA